MKSLKKMMFIAALGMGLGVSLSATALPPIDDCRDACVACKEGDQASCKLYRGPCRSYGPLC
ncbi:hypothetical protein [Pseudoduganella violacea]|uniref:Uncharacterized protein n=1 Tax=Pseudoduganella violacea TaxID=1715466 RepID=A0A7W5FSZ2_9BURK|nr:hypothetical protein [Pseudoduganella violacea]MBB3118087.1 hypothetical protein [Pseudoduganella violacea]